jgi:hypothetical protein
VPFADAVDLVAKLAKAPEVAECLATQWFRFALARAEERDDEPSKKELAAALVKTGDLCQMLVNIATSKSFTHRMAVAGEGQ